MCHYGENILPLLEGESSSVDKVGFICNVSQFLTHFLILLLVATLD